MMQRKTAQELIPDILELTDHPQSVGPDIVLKQSATELRHTDSVQMICELLLWFYPY